MGKIAFEFVEAYRATAARPKPYPQTFRSRPACLGSESGTAVTHYINAIRGKHASDVSAAIRQELSATDSGLTSSFYPGREPISCSGGLNTVFLPPRGGTTRGRAAYTSSKRAAGLTCINRIFMAAKTRRGDVVADNHNHHTEPESGADNAF